MPIERDAVASRFGEKVVTEFLDLDVELLALQTMIGGVVQTLLARMPI